MQIFKDCTETIVIQYTDNCVPPGHPMIYKEARRNIMSSNMYQQPQMPEQVVVKLWAFLTRYNLPIGSFSLGEEQLALTEGSDHT